MKTLRSIGLALVFGALVIAALLLSFLNTLSALSSESCTCGDTCEMVHFEVPWVFYGGMIAVVGLIAIGLYLSLAGPKLEQGDKKAEWGERANSLKGEEKAIYALIVDEGGTMFQSDIVERTDLSKVKVTRNLDRLESRGYLERRRRGLTNIIVLS